MGRTTRARDGPGAQPVNKTGNQRATSVQKASSKRAENVQWDKIKAEYLSTDTSIRKLAEKHNVPKSRLEARCKAERWPELRRQIQDKTETKIVEKISTKKADALDMIRDTALETLYALNMAAQNITKMLESPPAASEDGQKPKKLSDLVMGAAMADPLRSIASSLKTTQDVLYVAYSKLTPAQTESNKINLERLRIQKQMADIKTPTAGEQIHIIINPPQGAELPTDENGNPRAVTEEDLCG